MSVLSFPRLILNGTTAWNPATQNNALNFGYQKSNVTVDTNVLPAGVTLDNYDHWLIQFNSQTGTTNGDWNVYGQMQANFDAKVVNTLTGPGTSPAGDPVLGGALKFTGGTPKLVDVNPYSAVTSQVFLKNFGIDAGNNVGFRGAAAHRMTSRRPFFGRNTAGDLHIAGGMGVIWQTVIAKQDIDWAANAGTSPTLAALQSAMNDTGVLGIMIRMSSYTTIYFKDIVQGGWLQQSAPDVYQALADKWKTATNNYQDPVNVGNIASTFNPATSTLTGAIGLWQENEAMTVPTNRVLAAGAGDSNAATLGAAAAQFNTAQNVVSVDLMNCIPLTDSNNTAATLGDLTVTANRTDGSQQTIGTITQADYSNPTFDANGGIVDVSSAVDLNALSDATLSITSATGATTPLMEIPYVTEVDTRSVYVEDGGSTSFDVQVTFLGGPAPSGLKLRATLNVVDNQGTKADNVQLSGGVGAVDDMIFDVGSGGVTTVNVKGMVDGNCLCFVQAYDPATSQPPDMPTQGPAPTSGYAAIRVMPTDAAINNVPDSQVTWDYVYANVLRPFDLVYRGMSCGVFDLGNENSVKANASAIAAFTDPGQFESPLYMPVTRDLSSGRRELLMRFLGQPSSTAKVS